jgi:hypothetical protein
MPITYRVDHEVKVVFAEGTGTVTDDDVFGYQREVWSRPDVRGYNELVDVSAVKHVTLPSAQRVRDLAELSAEMEAQAGEAKRFAIVATSPIVYGLSRMFQTYREMDQRNKTQVKVFRNRQEALAFLGIGSPADQR